MYCSLDQARDAGAVGSDAEVTAAITAASARVERFTHELFAPVAATIVRDVGNGIVLTHLRIQTVTAVRYLGWATPITAEAYRVLTSETPGQVDSVILAGTLAWADVTVLGAEPWNGGWANLMYGNTSDPQVEIDGTFGWDTPPEDVAHATAVIAAQIRTKDRTPDSGSSTTPTDDEGNVIPVVPPFTASVNTDVQELLRVRARTTGSKSADELLAPYVREPVRIRA